MLYEVITEMTVLVGGMRVLNANYEDSPHGVFTSRPETLTNDYFVNLLDMSTEWQKSSGSDEVFEGRDRRPAHEDTELVGVVHHRCTQLHRRPPGYRRHQEPTLHLGHLRNNFV